jgi:microcystin-dependent protein
MRITLFLFVLCLFMTMNAYSQKGVGIGTTDPDGSAVLDVVAAGTPRGMLIPRLSTDDRNNIASPAEGLVVYDLTLKKFCFYSSGWYIIDAMTRPAAGTAITHTGDVTVAGTVSATNYGLNAVGNGPIPQGGIIMWSGSSVPTGWALCDGSNLTPDLRGRFIVGYHPGDAATPTVVTGMTTNYGAVGNTGGAGSVTLSTLQIPSHNHTMNSAGSHQHAWNYTMEKDDDNTGSSYDEFTEKPAANDPGRYVQFPMAAAGAHTHTINTTGGGGAHENRPPYYVLAFIMKL